MTWREIAERTRAAVAVLQALGNTLGGYPIQPQIERSKEQLWELCQLATLQEPDEIAAEFPEFARLEEP